MNNILEMSS